MAIGECSPEVRSFVFPPVIEGESQLELELASLFRCFFIQRHEVMKRLIQRYLLTFEKTRHQAPAPELPSERDEGQQLRELVTRLENVLRKTEPERPPDVAKKTDD